ncbi:SPOR domain-containing protein [Rhodothermus profundi]|uniref:Sporulation related domain-containing protein n=1 Tax=Rhodothermus profundi TaxID=633813 RepID=A0A1M6P5I0_9BACT|nr:SPOR domain-containing protein [Rhodothermus profundi]SHK03227.1 Sporulation related domain-containing protein [Rhodothermus profundi]
MSEPLINQLAERLGCAPEAAEAALRQLVAQLQQQLEQEGQTSLPGLGHLIRSEEGLRFEPDAALAQAVNHRFAGLEPVTVEPPAAQSYRKTEVIPPEESTSEEVAAPTSPFYEVEGPAESQETPAEEAAPEEPPHEAEAQPTPSPEVTSEAEPEPTPTEAAPEPPPASPPEPPLRPPRPPRIRVEEERRRGLPIWVPAALLVVMLGAVAVWFLLFSRPSEPEVPPPAPPQTETERLAPPETTVAALPPPVDTAVAEPETPTTEAPPARPPTGSYALIVGSVTSQAAAERLADRYRRALANQDLPVTVVATPMNGTTRYRVAVGRYGSPEEALAAKRQLSNVLPPDAWVLRLPSTIQ